MESSEPRRDPNKVKKHPPPQQQRRPPVIIYTDSPQVIHTSPSEFMSTVQRLTGAHPSASAPRNASTHMNTMPRTSDVDRHSGVETAAALAPLPDSLVGMSSGGFSQHQFGGCSSGYADDTLFASPHDNLLATPGHVVSSSPPPPDDDCWDPFNQNQI